MVLKLFSSQILLTLFVTQAYAGRPIFESFKVLGKGIIDDKTGDILQIACVDDEGNPARDSDCKLARFATTDRAGRTFFHGPAEDPFLVEKRPSQVGSNNWAIEKFPFSERFFVNLKAIRKADQLAPNNAENQPHRRMSHFLKFSRALSAGQALDVRDREYWQFKQDKIDHTLYQELTRSSLLDDDGISASKERRCAYRYIDLSDSNTVEQLKSWRYYPIQIQYEGNSQLSTLMNDIGDDSGSFMKNYIEDHSITPGISELFIHSPQKIGGFIASHHPEKVKMPLSEYAWYRMRVEMNINLLLRKNLRLAPHESSALTVMVSKSPTHQAYIRGGETHTYAGGPKAGGCFTFTFKDRNGNTWDKESCWNGKKKSDQFIKTLPTCDEIEKAGLAL